MSQIAVRRREDYRRLYKPLSGDQGAATRRRRDYEQVMKKVEPRRPEGSETSAREEAAKDHKEVMRGRKGPRAVMSN